MLANCTRLLLKFQDDLLYFSSPAFLPLLSVIHTSTVVLVFRGPSGARRDQDSAGGSAQLQIVREEVSLMGATYAGRESHDWFPGGYPETSWINGVSQ